MLVQQKVTGGGTLVAAFAVKDLSGDHRISAQG